MVKMYTSGKINLPSIQDKKGDMQITYHPFYI